MNDQQVLENVKSLIDEEKKASCTGLGNSENFNQDFRSSCDTTAWSDHYCVA